MWLLHSERAGTACMMKEKVANAGPVVQKLASRKALCVIEISYVGCIKS